MKLFSKGSICGLALLAMVVVVPSMSRADDLQQEGVAKIGSSQEGVARVGQSSSGAIIRGQSPMINDGMVRPMNCTEEGCSVGGCPQGCLSDGGYGNACQGNSCYGMCKPDHGLYCVCKECKAYRKGCKNPDSCFACKHTSMCPNCEGQFCDHCPVCQGGCLARSNSRFRNRCASTSYCMEEWLACHLGYFIPRGGADGKGLPPFGCYNMVYATDPSYFDQRDGQVYAAQGYGVPVGVPLAPNVHHSYNYSWGTPSSRLTPVGNVTSVPRY